MGRERWGCLVWTVATVEASGAVASGVRAAGDAGIIAGCARGCWCMSWSGETRIGRGEGGFPVSLARRVFAGRMNTSPSLSGAQTPSSRRPYTELRARPSDGRTWGYSKARHCKSVDTKRCCVGWGWRGGAGRGSPGPGWQDSRVGRVGLVRVGARRGGSGRGRARQHVGRGAWAAGHWGGRSEAGWLGKVGWGGARPARVSCEAEWGGAGRGEFAWRRRGARQGWLDGSGVV